MVTQVSWEESVRRRDSASSGWARWWNVWDAGAQPVSDRLVELAGIGAGDSVLDLATGLGEPAVTAARRVGPHGRVVATDSSPAMLHEAAMRAAAMGLSNIEFREMDAESPDLENVAFDAILCRWGFMFVPDLERSLRRLAGLLRPGGRLAAAAWGRPDEVPMIQTSASVVGMIAPLPDAPPGALHPFRLSDPGILIDAMKQAGLTGLSREEVRVDFEFTSAEEYTRFRRDMTTLDAQLAEHHPPGVVEAVWQAVTEAARSYRTAEGRVRFVNTAVCFAGSR